MGSKGSNISRVLMCVLMLGLVLEQVQVDAKSCCRNTLARNCYNSCRLTGTSQAQCAKLCDCIHITGTKCPPSHPKLNFLPNFEEPDSIRYCSLGCRSVVCDNMNNDGASPIYGSKEMETIVERCAEGCDRFCNRDASIASVAA